jgi:hypothetical protein
LEVCKDYREHRSRCSGYYRENDGEFILSGIAIKNWNNLLMQEGLKEHNKAEEESEEEVIMPEDIEETSKDDLDAHWFPFEWFLDTYVGVDYRPHVTSDLSVMSTNKNHWLPSKLQMDIC